MVVESRSASVPATLAEEGEEAGTRGGVLSSTPPSPAAAPPSTWGSSRSGGDVAERPAGDMATTRPRLCLWQPRRRNAGVGGDGLPPRRREVTFRDCEAASEGISGGGGKVPTTPPTGAATAAAAATTVALAATAAAWGTEEEKTTGGGDGRVDGGSGNLLLRPDFIQLSYAMNKSPTRSDCAGRAGVISEREVQRGQVRASTVSIAIQLFFGCLVYSELVLLVLILVQ